MKPASETELAEMIQAATGPLSVIGGGTRLRWRPVTGAPLSSAGLSGVRLYEPGALTLVAGAGTPVDEIVGVLVEKGQRLAFEPPDMRGLMGHDGTPTIGGVVAANASGPRRVQLGACRDFLLGVRFVDGAGRIVKNGGRVMKNVTGYDLVKLMAGSFGTLGVLSEVSLKVLAVPQAEATLIARDLPLDQALGALRAALATPFDISGACHDATGAEAQTRLRIEGMAGSVRYRSERLRAAVCAGWDLVEGADSAELWRATRDASAFVGSNEAVWKISTMPGRAEDLMATLTAQDLAHRALFDWGGGLIWLAVPQTGDSGAALIRATLARLGGHATLLRADGRLRQAAPMFQPRDPALALLETGLRDRFDPRGILNPGLMGARQKVGTA
ncbi:FAD-binding protein [Pseudooceanicola sp.]|uniref:FAD-binding protein n=1 Tax=Pseudooceanicola sp. TaxID=1914328 RepID=UPI002608F86E|nr:FAD-binding protein [Pseudooceanicola sp.]MDF1855074.1 FAD-binding protein [Pseudooceanicola sp.]